MTPAERPILFSGPMVRAFLDRRKTQTRRTRGLDFYSQNDPDNWHCARVRDGVAFMVYSNTPTEHQERCPFGQPGDSLWVREAWCQPTDQPLIVYRADYPACVPPNRENLPPADELRWKPSIHMPRKFARILLRVTDVRVERLNAISSEDAAAEGWPGPDEHNSIRSSYPIAWFAALWDSINGRGAYDKNPWVWAIHFEQVEKQT